MLNAFTNVNGQRRCSGRRWTGWREECALAGKDELFKQLKGEVVRSPAKRRGTPKKCLSGWAGRSQRCAAMWPGWAGISRDFAGGSGWHRHAGAAQRLTRSCEHVCEVLAAGDCELRHRLLARRRSPSAANRGVRRSRKRLPLRPWSTFGPLEVAGREGIWLLLRGVVF